MKYKEILLEQLKSAPYFSKETIRQISKQYGLKKSTVDSYISRSLARKDIIQFKKGLYVTTDFYNKNKSDSSYSFYLANVLRAPSYVSSWTALEYYNLATDVIHTIISVTPKITRNYATKAGNFEYHSIKEDLFSGFSLVKGKFDFFIASPSKAIFDLLYFKTRRFQNVKIGQVKTLVRELRVDIDEMEKSEMDNLFIMINNYINNE